MKNLYYRNPLFFTLVALLLILLFACQKKVDYPTLASTASLQEGSISSPAASTQLESSETTKLTSPTSSAQQESGSATTTKTIPEPTTSSSLPQNSPAPTSSAAASAATSQSSPDPASSAAQPQATTKPDPPATRPATTTTRPATTTTRPAPTTTRPATTTRPNPVTTTRPTQATTRPAQTTTTRTAATTTRASSPSGQIDYRQEMRDFVIRLSDSGKARSSGFLVVVQNGEDIIQEGNQWQKDYLSAVDGIGREDFLYGASRDDVATSARETTYIKRYLDQFLAYGNKVMIADYCYTPAYVLDSYNKNNSYGYISFAADQRELNSIPSYPQPIYAENTSSVNSLAAAKNFLYLINPEKFKSKSEYLAAIGKTNYDLIIIDLFYEGTALSKADLAALKQKSSGAKRLVLAYMSIGEAEDYRYYWQKDWRSSPPAWLGKQNPNWPGNYLVKYWDPAWQNIIIGQADSYLNRIIDAGFDGVYLDLIDAYEYYS